MSRETRVIVCPIWYTGSDAPIHLVSRERNTHPACVEEQDTHLRGGAYLYAWCIAHADGEHYLVVRAQAAECGRYDGIERVRAQCDGVGCGDPCIERGVERGEIVQGDLDDLDAVVGRCRVVKWVTSRKDLEAIWKPQ